VAATFEMAAAQMVNYKRLWEEMIPMITLFSLGFRIALDFVI
jgi:hypothetical protein